MAKEESLRSKNLYKILLIALKVLPMAISLCYLLNTIFAYIGYNTEVFSFIGGVSLLPWLFLYLAATVFRFCMYHKIFLIYILVSDLINYADYYFDFTTIHQFFMIQTILFGITIFIALYLYKRKV